MNSIAILDGTPIRMMSPRDFQDPYAIRSKTQGAHTAKLFFPAAKVLLDVLLPYLLGR